MSSGEETPPKEEKEEKSFLEANPSFKNLMDSFMTRMEGKIQSINNNVESFKNEIITSISDSSAENKVQIDDIKQRLDVLEKEKITIISTQKHDNIGVESKVKSQTEAITGLEDRLARTERRVLTLQTPIATPQSAGNESGGTGQPMLSASSRTTPQVFKVRSPVHLAGSVVVHNDPPCPRTHQFPSSSKHALEHAKNNPFVANADPLAQIHSYAGSFNYIFMPWLLKYSDYLHRMFGDDFNISRMNALRGHLKQKPNVPNAPIMFRVFHGHEVISLDSANLSWYNDFVEKAITLKDNKGAPKWQVPSRLDPSCVFYDSDSNLLYPHFCSVDRLCAYLIWKYYRGGDVVLYPTGLGLDYMREILECDEVDSHGGLTRWVTCVISQLNSNGSTDEIAAMTSQLMELKFDPNVLDLATWVFAAKQILDVLLRKMHPDDAAREKSELTLGLWRKASNFLTLYYTSEFVEQNTGHPDYKFMCVLKDIGILMRRKRVYEPQVAAKPVRSIAEEMFLLMLKSWGHFHGAILTILSDAPVSPKPMPNNLVPAVSEATQTLIEARYEQFQASYTRHLTAKESQVGLLTSNTDESAYYSRRVPSDNYNSPSYSEEASAPRKLPPPPSGRPRFPKSTSFSSRPTSFSSNRSSARDRETLKNKQVQHKFQPQKSFNNSSNIKASMDLVLAAKNCRSMTHPPYKLRDKSTAELLKLLADINGKLHEALNNEFAKPLRANLTQCSESVRDEMASRLDHASNFHMSYDLSEDRLIEFCQQEVLQESLDSYMTKFPLECDDDESDSPDFQQEGECT